jgi:hypothetical protein
LDSNHRRLSRATAFTAQPLWPLGHLSVGLLAFPARLLLRLDQIQTRVSSSRAFGFQGEGLPPHFGLLLWCFLVRSFHSDGQRWSRYWRKTDQTFCTTRTLGATCGFVPKTCFQPPTMSFTQKATQWLRGTEMTRWAHTRT